MKSVHKALRLHHHKHTGKILAHKHTSYRVLFLLMLLPIMMLALVNHLDVTAGELMVNAKVPAPMPNDAPVIRAPQSGSMLDSRDIVIEGTCPVISPAVVIAIYDNGTLVGSVVCSEGGSFSVPVTLALGTHSLVATVVTITDDIGKSSAPVTLTVDPVTDTSPISGVEEVSIPLHIMSEDIFVLVNADGHVKWKGNFAGGTPPYKVEIDWGDGKTDVHNITDSSEQTFTHRYDAARIYEIRIIATDATGVRAVLHLAGITQFIAIGAAGLDANLDQMHPVIAFVQRYMWQIYIGSLSALVFLWYIEHGRHAVARIRVHHKPRYRH